MEGTDSAITAPLCSRYCSAIVMSPSPFYRWGYQGWEMLMNSPHSIVAHLKSHFQHYCSVIFNYPRSNVFSSRPVHQRYILCCLSLSAIVSIIGFAVRPTFWGPSPSSTSYHSGDLQLVLRPLWALASHLWDKLMSINSSWSLFVNWLS